MTEKGLAKERGRIIRYTLLGFLVLSAFYFVISLIIQTSTDRVSREELLNHNLSFVKSEQVVVTSRIARIISDLLFIKDSLQLSTATESASPVTASVEQQWIVFSNRKKAYDQISYLDIDGNEVFRIDNSGANAYPVAENQLQNRKQRYYFSDALVMPENHIYLSSVDLKVQNGKIQRPYQPIMRLSTSLFDLGGKLKGVVAFDYAMRDMLDQIIRTSGANFGALYLLNANGYWLYNSENPDKEWGFMFQDKVSTSFHQVFPREWEAIAAKGSGTLVTENGAFLYTNILDATELSTDSGGHSLTLGGGEWYLVSYISPQSKYGTLIRGNLWDAITASLASNYYAYLMILFIAFVIAILLGINRLERRKIKYFSEYDVMTGTLNRRAGLERLSQIHINSNDDMRCCVSICFADINGLKEVNDMLGHDVGDELIRTVTTEIKASIRAQDFVTRLGGDEFLIVFSGIEEDACEMIWQRILKRFDVINDAEKRRYIISISHGIETYKGDATPLMDAIINRADEKMYAEKRKIKQHLHVIRTETAAIDAPPDSAGEAQTGPAS